VGQCQGIPPVTRLGDFGYGRHTAVECLSLMDNAHTALFVGLGGVLATAFAGIMPSVFSHRLEKSRLKESRDEHSWQRRRAEIERHLELSDRALDTLVEFLGYADQLSRGHDVVIAHHARSSRLRAVAELIKFWVSGLNG